MPLPFICPNPLDGQLHPTKSGALSYRCDAAVCKFIRELFEKSSLKPAKTFPHFATSLQNIKVLRGFGRSFTKDLSKFEFDTLSRAEQFAFWGEMLNELPVIALIDSGNKSLHAWIRVPNVRTFEEWKIKIEQKFFEQCLKPLGIDTACKSPSHMSRLPGCIRKGTGRWQRLLYLNPEAGMK